MIIFELLVNMDRTSDIVGRSAMNLECIELRLSTLLTPALLGAAPLMMSQQYLELDTAGIDSKPALSTKSSVNTFKLCGCK